MTVTVIRPNGTLYTGGWRDDGGAVNLHTPTSDNSDSTYIHNNGIFYPAAGDNCTIALGDISALTATQRIMRVRWRVRFVKNGVANAAQRARFTLEDRYAAPIQRFPDTTVYATSTTAADTAAAWHLARPGGVEWSRTVVNAMGMVVTNVRPSDGTAFSLRLLEIYVDVDIHDQATINTPTITGHTTSARPTVTWTYTTNADNDQQRSYQVKVFTDAQTNAAGFDPTTTAAVWDSGQVRSTNTAVVVGQNLVNGVTYTAYARSSQEFNGTDWWTAFSASADFTMAYVAPPTPTLTVTAETVLPSLRNLLVVDTKLNLLTGDDASLEATIGTWTNLANATVARSNTQALNGSWSLRLTASGAGNMAAGTIGGVFSYLASPGQQYTALASFRAATTGRSCRVLMQWIDNAGVLLSTATGSNVTDTTGGFTQGFVTGTAPASTAGIRVVVEVLSAAAAEQHFADQMSLHTGASTTWTMGGLQKLDSIGFERVDRTVIEFLDWNMPTADTTNIINPNMATGGESFGDHHGFFKRHPEDRVELDRSGLARNGEACIRWIVGEGTGSILDLGTPQGVYSWTEVPHATLPGVPGRTYTLSFYVRSVSGSHDLRLSIISIDQTGATIGSITNGSTVSVGTSWVRLSVTHTMAANSAGMRGELQNLGGTLDEYLIDQGQFEQAAAATTWRRSNIMIPDWRPVRGALTALQAEIRDGVARIYDREAPPGVIRLYRAWTEVDAGDGAFARSAFAAYVPTQIDPPGRYILKDPQQQVWDLVITAGHISEHIDEDFAEAHPIRPNDRQPYGKRPVFVSDWISGKNGQLAMTVRPAEDWFALQALLHTSRPLLLQLPGGGQRYVKFTARSWPRPKEQVDLWRVIADFSEVARPVVTA